MSLVEHFLPKHLQSPSNIKYFHSLLSLPVNKLEKEKASIQSKIDHLETQIRSHAIQESKDFVHVLSQNTSLLELSSSLNTLLESCSQATLLFKTQVLDQSLIIDEVLIEQQKLENLSNLQSVIGEILEIPQLLKNLVNSKHYKETLDLLFFAEKIEAQGPAFDEIRQVAKETRARVLKELLGIIHESFNYDKLKETFNLIQVLDPESDPNHLLLNCKKDYFIETISRKTAARFTFTELLSSVHSFLEKFSKLTSLFPSIDLIGFNIDIICTIFHLFSQYSPQSLSELSTIACKLSELNDQFFIPEKCDMWPETYKLLERNIKEKLELYSKKTLINYENLVKLYGWQVSPNQSSPLLEFGSIAVLYNNCVTIINEVRQIPLPSCKSVFFTEISNILQGSIQIVKEKAKSLLNGRFLNKQEEIMKDLMLRYIECLKSQALGQIVEFALETFEDCEEFREMMVNGMKEKSIVFSVE